MNTRTSAVEPDLPNPAAQQGLEVEDDDIEVGHRLRAIRQLRGRTLKQVADQASVSPSFLSQVERGLAAASIASLKRIAASLDLSMSDLFEPNALERPRILRRRDRPALAFGHLGKKYLVTPRPLQFLEVFVGEFEPDGTTGEAYSHGDSEELFMVLEGRVQLQVEEQIFDMEPGDSIDYRSSAMHRVSNPYAEPAQVLWIISPPSY